MSLRKLHRMAGEPTVVVYRKKGMPRVRVEIPADQDPFKVLERCFAEVDAQAKTAGPGDPELDGKVHREL